MKAIVDIELCISCGLCADECPEVFMMGEDGFAHTIGESVPPEQSDCVAQAVEICPVTAISTVA